jgi:hypothetical protein
MAATIVETPGSATANSYETVAEATAYFETRSPLATPWEDQDNQAALLIMGTRVLDAMFRGTKIYVQASGSTPAHYLVRRAWTGAPATTTQRLAWPRTGMLDQNGNAIDSAVIPQDLKDALAELAGQLGLTDRTLDNDVAVQGITSVRAGSVSVSFRDGSILSQVIPEAVLNLIPPSWYTEEQELGVSPFLLEVM